MQETGRVIEVQRVHVTVASEQGDVLLATVRGEFHQTGEYPKVGDFVVFSRVAESEEAQAVIEKVLPRTSVIERFDEVNNLNQVLVANVDLFVVVMGLDNDFNMSRLERYVALAAQSNISAVVVLNKTDMADEAETKRQQVIAAVGDVPVLLTQADTGAGLEALREMITSDTTAVLLGSSGAGKSTITNWLLGTTQQETQTVRQDDSRGRHTTTTRQLFTIPGGGFLIDTPGMRELALVEQNDDAALVEQVETLASQCQFRNCDHEKSAGCAVLAAVESGELTERTLANYYKLARERSWQQEKNQGGRGQHGEQVERRAAQANAAAKRRRLSRG